MIMRYTKLLLGALGLLLLLYSCQNNADEDMTSAAQQSPDGLLSLQVFLSPDGAPQYTLKYGEELLLDTSTLGVALYNGPLLQRGLAITGTQMRSVADTWEMPWGERRTVDNQFNELSVSFRESPPPHRAFRAVFRLFNDGMGFRYEFPEQEGISTFEIAEELTQFNLNGDHDCWWIPGDWDIYEHLYTESKVSAIDALSKRGHPNLAQTHIPANAVNTPVTMRTAAGTHLSIHEANLTDYAGMTLAVDTEGLSLQSSLVGSERTPYKVKRTLPFHTPWRTVQVSPDAAGLIGSTLILNLNEPNQLGDVSWFKPTKYMGIWWEMHLDKSSWDLASGRHGATTENAKRYIDFAASHGIGALLVEGWNTGWERWIGFEDREGVFDFVTPYEDYDLEEVVRYGREKGVELIMHHETSAAPRTYEQQLDTAFALMQKLGVHAVKTGYVGKIIPKGEYHHGQWMVNHYRKVLETAAEYEVAINAHEPIKATGLRRTFPNAISREGLRGQEFNAWASDGGNPPGHLPTVAFTRMLAGPIDYTPGIFNIKLHPYKPDNQVNTTLAHQLALYVAIYSPVQMAADLPEHYEGHPAFQFIEEVGVDWEQSLALNGEVGAYVTIAREERGTGRWFLGSITNEDGRELEAPLSFLAEGQQYVAHLYEDGADAHWDDNPGAYRISKAIVDRSTTLHLKLAPGGGAAVSFFPASGEEAEGILPYGQ